MQTVTTQLNELTLRDDEILVVRSLNPGLSRTAEPVEEMYTALEQLLNGKRLPMLWDPRAIRSIRPDGWVAIIDRLEADLMLVYGELDENVPFRAAMAIFDALIKADKDFTSYVVPNATHGTAVLNPYIVKRQRQFFIDHLGGPIPQ